MRRLPYLAEASLFMGYIQGEGRKNTVSGARVEVSLATMAYNLKRITNVLGATKLTEALHHA